MKKRLRDSEKGFTLIELIVAVGVIGVLAAIAIPQYSTYKARAKDSQMQSAIKNARTAMEAYYIEAQTYTDDETTLADPKYGYNDNGEVLLDIFFSSATDYSMRTCAEGGTFRSWEFSTVGANAGATVGTNNPCS